MSYEAGDLEGAAEYFRQAVQTENDNPIALFNLGSTLDDLGLWAEARQHLRLATRLDPNYADAHFNLAVVCDKMNAEHEAREHWNAYIKLEPTGNHADYARTRLA
jgi:tetratricopeptide (TPR) repeat protein